MREYAIGRRRMDLLIKWPYGDRDEAGQRKVQREAVELKVWHEGKRDPLEEGLVQLSPYLSGLSLASGTLILFDRREDVAPLEERVTREFLERDGRRIQLIRA